MQLDLHDLSAEAAESEKSSILDTSGELEFRKYLLSQSSEPDSDVDSPNICSNCMKEGEELRRRTCCKFVRYCPKLPGDRLVLSQTIVPIHPDDCLFATSLDYVFTRANVFIGK